MRALALFVLTSLGFSAVLVVAAEPAQKQKDEIARQIKEFSSTADILKQVDFTKEYLLLFRWKSWGGDILTYSVEEKGPVVVIRQEVVGAGKIATEHVYLYAIAKQATWRVDESKRQSALKISMVNAIKMTNRQEVEKVFPESEKK